MTSTCIYIYILELGYSNSDSDSSPDSSAIMNELGLVRYSDEFALGLVTDSDILDSGILPSTVESALCVT